MDKPAGKSSKHWTIPGFTIVELLVVVAITIILLAIIVPSIQRALASGRAAKCKGNLRALYSANMLYASDEGFYVPGAADIRERNLERWHGSRGNIREAFRGESGPLSRYLGGAGMVRTCPSFARYQTDPDADNAFESSCGGYGYNLRGVGSRLYLMGDRPAAYDRGMAPDMIDQPAKTVMFCDTAFAQPYGRPEYLIEYSFAEPYSFSLERDGKGGHRTTPSIHFRHRGRSQVAWCDGHVSAVEPQLQPTSPHDEFDINWLGPADNSLFDPY